MLGICSACGNTEWDKEVTGNVIKCPKCGNEWKFDKLPIFFLTGCSGVGKTTTAIELQKITDEYVIIDADWLRNIAGHKMMKKKMILLNRYILFQRIYLNAKSL